MIRWLCGLLAIDAVVTFVFVLAPAAVAPAVAPDAAPAARASAVDPAEVGRRLGALHLAARRAARGKKVTVAPPRRVADGVELRVFLARDIGFPSSLYCVRCPAQRCLFPEATVAALDALAQAFPVTEVRELARLAPVEVTYVGGASAGPVVPRDVVQSCANGVPQTSIRFPAGFDVYDEKECGARACAGGGAAASGPIEDNQELACLRAACLAERIDGVSVTYLGEVAAEQGVAYRGAEVALKVHGVSPAAWPALLAAAEEEPQ